MMPSLTIREAVVRYRGSPRAVSDAILDPEHAARFVRRLVGEDAREHFVAIMLDARHVPIAYQVVSIGTATASLVHPREVFQPAVGVGAAALIVAHNHPSGNPLPSPEDREVTVRLARAGALLGIRLLDSVIVAQSEHVSLRDENPEAFDRAAIAT